MKRIVAPQRGGWAGSSVFLAGGITNCPEWQDRAAEVLLEVVNVLDPRRKPWPEGGDMGEQVKWEYDHLRMARYVLFWFPAESICPIALFELGSMWERQWHSAADVFVGCHPRYPRWADLEAQREAFGVKRPIVYKLEELIETVRLAVMHDSRILSGASSRST